VVPKVNQDWYGESCLPLLLPSPALTSLPSSTPLPLPCIIPLSLEVGLHNSRQRVWGSTVSSPSGAWGRNRFGCILALKSDIYRTFGEDSMLSSAEAVIRFGPMRNNLTSSGNTFNDFSENQLPKFRRIGMAPLYQISDWSGSRQSAIRAIPLQALLRTGNGHDTTVLITHPSS